MKDKFPKRKNPRLSGYDYRKSGAYFITICTYQRQLLFGNINEDGFSISAIGCIVLDCWCEIPQHYNHAVLDKFIIMPNHLHGIIFLDNDNKKQSSLSRVIGTFKSSVTRLARQKHNQPNLNIWQKSFHDHIIRNEQSLNQLRNYTQHNVDLWLEDQFYSD